MRESTFPVAFARSGGGRPVEWMGDKDYASAVGTLVERQRPADAASLQTQQAANPPQRRSALRLLPKWQQLLVIHGSALDHSQSGLPLTMVFSG